MFGLAFRFPAGRYHATPWGRNVNEADVAWPPEPWRILRALLACYWRKGDHERWSEEHLTRLIDALVEELPVFRLPVGGVHAHTRHYMPIRKGKSESRTLVFDAFLHLSGGAEIQILWQDVALDLDLLSLAQDLASGIGYLGRAESWCECRVITEADGEPNCGPAERGFTGETCRLLVPRTTESYRVERERLISQETGRIRSSSKKPLTEHALRGRIERSFRSKTGVDTLPSRLLNALAVETADLQNRKWDRPPAAYEAIYARDRSASPSVISHPVSRVVKFSKIPREPTVARFLLAGRPRPRIEDAVKIGEVMRAAVMSQFGWESDKETGRRFPLAPWQISGRCNRNQSIRDPTHPHAFWLPEDADNDGWIDHITVFIGDGMNEKIRIHLNRITRIWLTPRGHRNTRDDLKIDEWRLALEGFGYPEDFAGSSGLLATSRRWRSATPFLASGHLKKAGHHGDLVRLMKRRGIDTEGVMIKELTEITVGGRPRRALNFYRFRSRRGEVQRDCSGALLEIELQQAIQGPLALGYASHFGLGTFETVAE